MPSWPVRTTRSCERPRWPIEMPCSPSLPGWPPAARCSSSLTSTSTSPSPTQPSRVASSGGAGARRAARASPVLFDPAGDQTSGGAMRLSEIDGQVQGPVGGSDLSSCLATLQELGLVEYHRPVVGERVGVSWWPARPNGHASRSGSPGSTTRDGSRATSPALTRTPRSSCLAARSTLGWWPRRAKSVSGW